MNLRWLRYFLAVASTLSFSRAAENLHISQSTLSQQIRQLEEYYGVTLFNREGRAITLTPAGIEMQEAASRLLAENDHLRERLRSVESGAKIEKWPLRIFFDGHMTMGPHMINRIIESVLVLQREMEGKISFYPQFKSADLDDPQLDMEEVLKDPQVDMWLIGSESNLRHSAIRFQTLFVDHFALLISRNHPLYRDDLSLADVPHILNNTMLFMIQNRSRHLRDVLDRLPGCEEVSPAIHFERSAEVISVYVALGIGVSIVPEDNRNLNMVSDCKSIAIPGTSFYTLLGCRPDEENPLVLWLMDRLRRQFPVQEDE